MNPLVKHTTSTSNASPEGAFMCQAPPPPKRIESIDDVEIYQDERTGRRYSFNSQTQETKWLEDEDIQTGNPTVVATLTNDDPTVEIHTDPTSGKRYSWNATTSEATWLDGNQPGQQQVQLETKEDKQKERKKAQSPAVACCDEKEIKIQAK